VVHGDIDETAVPLVHEHPGESPRDQEVAGQVGRHDVSESGRVDVEERLRLLQEAGIDRPHPDPGVVDDQVDTPSRECAAATAASTDSGSRTSTGTGSADKPPARCSATNSDSRGVGRAAMPTAAPARSRAIAIAAPMPLVAPVTTAFTPDSSCTGLP
jgi:hypothetical protein